MFVLGTAGHIDHGKSSLVRALTGIDPDRLREEKEREMTIDLGFAWFKLPSGREVGVVDMPGHERFVKNMLAGVGGIDLALLIVAANEGVMPQTREHLSILDLLKVKKGIVVITKRDLVDEELLSLVRMEVEELISNTSLSKSPIVAVSSVTAQGLPDLLVTIDRLLDSTEPRRDLGRPRLPIDRIFTIAGAGTVVTGTLIDGSLSVGQEVEIQPSGLKSRLRGLQTHKTKLTAVEPGSRVAANLVGVNVSELKRGDVVTKPGCLTPTKMVSVKLQLLSYIPRPLKHNSNVSFYTGASETQARVRLLESEELKPGMLTWAQISLAEPVAAVNGDHFIIRSPMETLGGGEIIDSQSRRLRRFRPEVIESLKSREAGGAEGLVMALLEAKQPLDLSSLTAQGNLPSGEAKALIESMTEQNRLVSIGQGERQIFFTSNGWEAFTRKAISALEEYHRKYPIRPGMPRVELGSRLKMGEHTPSALQKLAACGSVVEEGNIVRLPSHRVQLTPSQQSKIDSFLRSLKENPYTPSAELIPEPDLLNLLIEQRKVVKVTENVVFSAAAYDEMVDKITSYLKAHGKVSLGEVRDMLNTSRKYAQALLEYLDGKKVTRRVGDERVLCQLSN